MMPPLKDPIMNALFNSSFPILIVECIVLRVSSSLVRFCFCLSLRDLHVNDAEKMNLVSIVPSFCRKDCKVTTSAAHEIVDQQFHTK